jgi:hypothetical protein
MGRTLHPLEGVAFCIIVILGGALAPSAHRILIEAALLVPLSVYNAVVSRGRWSYAFVAIAMSLVILAALLPISTPTGPAPD